MSRAAPGTSPEIPPSQPRESGGAPVTLYSRPDCHLCDEARIGLQAMRIDFDEVDIDSDERLHAALLERIPVVEVDGAVVCELWLDEAAVRAAITSTK